MAQEAQLPDGDGTHRPWGETPSPVPGDHHFGKSSGVSFSLQEYLKDENGLERCIAGLPEDHRRSSSPERYTVREVVQLDTHGRPPILVTDSATNAGLSESDYVEVDYAEVMRAPNGAASDNEGLDAIVNEVISLGSRSTQSSAPSESTTSSQPSNRSLLDPSLAPPSSSVRYASLHRQLLEAGLAGLGDEANGFQLYYR